MTDHTDPVSDEFTPSADLKKSPDLEMVIAEDVGKSYELSTDEISNKVSTISCDTFDSCSAPMMIDTPLTLGLRLGK